MFFLLPLPVQPQAGDLAQCPCLTVRKEQFSVQWTAGAFMELTCIKSTCWGMVGFWECSHLHKVACKLSFLFSFLTKQCENAYCQRINRTTGVSMICKLDITHSVHHLTMTCTTRSTGNFWKVPRALTPDSCVCVHGCSAGSLRGNTAFKDKLATPPSWCWPVGPVMSPDEASFYSLLKMEQLLLVVN